MEKFRPDSLTLQWHITERCPWRCKHCYQESYTTPEMKLDELFAVRDQFLELLDSFDPPLKKGHINITGGEPFVRTDILEFLAGIAKYKDRWTWSLLSNGAFLNKENVKYVAALGINGFQVSMEGMEEQNDAIRGKDAFRKTVNALKLLVEAGSGTRVSLTLTRKNKDEIFKMAVFLSGLGVRRLGVRRVVPWGNGEGMREFMPEPEELQRLYEEIERTNAWLIDHGHFLRVGGGCESGFFYDKVKSHPKTGEPLMTRNRCGVKDGRIIVVMPDGAVFPCRRFPIPLGKLSERSLADIYNSPIMSGFRNFETDPALSDCRKCVNWKNCFGGALCVNYGFAGKWKMPDVQCDRAFHSLEEAAKFAKTI